MEIIFGLFAASLIFLHLIKYLQRHRITIIIWRLITITLSFAIYSLWVSTFYYFEYYYKSEIIIANILILILFLINIKNLVNDFKNLDQISKHNKILRRLYSCLFVYFSLNFLIFIYVNIFSIEYWAESSSMYNSHEITITRSGLYHDRITDRDELTAEERYGFSYITNESIRFFELFPYPSYKIAYRKPKNTCKCERTWDVNFYYKFDLSLSKHYCMKVTEKIKY